MFLLYLIPFIPAFIWTILIIVLSTANPQNIPDFNIFSQDKIYHFAAYMLMSALWIWGFYKIEKNKNSLQLKIVFLCGVLGLLMEIVQWAFFPMRSFDWADGIANFTGAIIGFFFIKKYFSISNTRRE